jgi:tetratricopeptide (TPR) repeat protein
MDPSRRVASLAIFALAILAYANTLGHGFVWDDPILLEQKVRFYRGPFDAWSEPPGLPNMRMYRPLEMMSVWIDQSLWWRNGFGFHLTQVLLHAANGVLVLLLLLALGATTWPALAGAALFVAHPVQVESVAWITCRADVLTGTFAVLAMLAFLRHQAEPTWWTLAGIAIAAFLCTASKETGSVTPLLLLAAAGALPRPTVPLGPRLRRAWPALAAATAGVALCHALRPHDVTTGIGRSGLGAQDLVNLLGAFGYQIARVLAPIGFAPYVPTTPTDAAHLALALAGLAGIVALIAAPPRDGGGRRLAALWFVIAVAPAVTVVLADFSVTPVAERRLYLAMVGIALLAASALTRNVSLVTSRLGTLAIGTLLAVLLAITMTRNGHWRDELTLWSAVTARIQTEPLPYLNLGLALATAKRPVEAESAYRRALTLAPNDVTRQRTSINLGLLLVDRGVLDEAQVLFEQANATGPHAIAFRGLGMIGRRRAQSAARAGDVATASTELTRAHQALERALALNPRYYQARVTLAGVLYDAGQYRSALAQYQRVVELAGDTEAGRNANAAAAELSAWLAAHPEAP